MRCGWRGECVCVVCELRSYCSLGVIMWHLHADSFTSLNKLRRWYLWKVGWVPG